MRGPKTTVAPRAPPTTILSSGPGASAPAPTVRRSPVLLRGRQPVLRNDGQTWTCRKFKQGNGLPSRARRARGRAGSGSPHFGPGPLGCPDQCCALSSEDAVMIQKQPNDPNQPQGPVPAGSSPP